MQLKNIREYAVNKLSDKTNDANKAVNIELISTDLNNKVDEIKSLQSRVIHTVQIEEMPKSLCRNKEIVNQRLSENSRSDQLNEAAVEEQVTLFSIREFSQENVKGSMPLVNLNRIESCIEEVRVNDEPILFVEDISEENINIPLLNVNQN